MFASRSLIVVAEHRWKNAEGGLIICILLLHHLQRYFEIYFHEFVSSKVYLSKCMIQKLNFFFIIIKIKGKFMPKELHLSLKNAISGEVDQNDHG